MGQKGITFIELLVTITILTVLASVVVPLSQMSVKRQKEAQLRRDLRIMRSAIDAYKNAWDEGKIKKKIEDSGYPPDLNVLVEGVADITSPKPKNIFFLRRIPPDPMNQDVPAEEAWGLRSYASSPDDPKEGDDVFDVYTKSEGIAIDGTPYKRW